MELSNLTQLGLRYTIERFLRREPGVHIHGAGTDLSTQVMDISFDVDGAAYRLDLRRIERNDR